MLFITSRYVIYITAYIRCIIYYMEKPPTSPNRYGAPAGGIRQSDVNLAADALLRAGDRPTVEKIRTQLGRGSPNTINPMLDAWWKTLSARLDAGPAALHRLPETVAHVAEALWMQTLDEARRRAQQELKTSERLAADQQQDLEVRSHVLTLREGELDSRLRNRDRTIEDLNLRLRELTGLLRKEQVTRDSLSRQIAQLQSARAPKPRPQSKPRSKVTRRTLGRKGFLAKKKTRKPSKRR
jgi:hypothetical protein